MSNETVKESQPAPDFTLPAVGSQDIVQDGQVWLSALRGKTTVLYFYPKDSTPGSVMEACSFRDADRQMQQRGIVVLGVSTDNAASHQKFADKYHLPFPLLADTDARVAQLYGVKKGLFGLLSRDTILIDREGTMRKIWRNVMPGDHARKVLETIESLGLVS
jgi:thioredoxin-dependent peroxiredoxin